MQIVAVDAHPLDLHHVPEHRTSFTVYKGIGNVLVTVTTDDGTIGIGEGALIPRHLGEDQATAIRLVDEVFGPALLGADPQDTNRIRRLLRSASAEGRGAKSAIDMAIHDALGKAYGVPLHRLLGGRVRERFTTATGVGFGESHEMVADIQRHVAAGFSSFEVKMSGDAHEDLQRCLAIAHEIGEEASLILDPNEAWSVTDTIDIGRRLSRWGHRFYFEQPVAKENIGGMAQARRAMGVPIIAHEPITSARTAYEVLRCEAADIINVTIARLGSFRECLDTIAICEAAGIGFRIDAPIQSRIGDTALAHLGVGTHHVLAACDTHLNVTGEPELRGGLIVEPPWVTVPDEPGLGVELVDPPAKGERP